VRSAPASAPSEATVAPPDNGQYLSRLIAYIPAEAISVHQAIRGFVPEPERLSVMPWVEGLLIIATPIWVSVMTRNNAEPVAWHQVVISTLAFIVWLLAVKAALFASLGWPDYYGSIIMVACGIMVFPLLEQLFRRLP
jgi:hypothetical protein